MTDAQIIALITVIGVVTAGVFTMIGTLFGGSLTEYTKHRLTNPKPKSNKKYIWLKFYFFSTLIYFVFNIITLDPSKKSDIVFLVIAGMFLVFSVVFIAQQKNEAIFDDIEEFAKLTGERLELMDEIRSLTREKAEVKEIHLLQKMAETIDQNTAQNDVQKNKTGKRKNSTDSPKS